MHSNKPVFRLSAAAPTLIAGVMFAGTPAAAKGFLESLFGIFTPKPQHQRAAPPQRQAAPGAGEAWTNPFDNRRAKWSTAGGGRYKTMCVRLCDGFYFPISNSAPRRAFYRDAEMCQSQCDSETRLFFMPKDGGSIEEARDQSGLNYKELPNAFVYRDTLDQSCTCRAKPWSEAERNRHKRYAMIEAGQLDPKDAVLETAEMDGEGGDETVVAVDNDLAVAPMSISVAPVVRRPAVVVRRPVRAAKRPMSQPAYGLGAFFQANAGSASNKLKRVKQKFQWPGDSDR